MDALVPEPLRVGALASCAFVLVGMAVTVRRDAGCQRGRGHV
jgi:hypothetical protein